MWKKGIRNIVVITAGFKEIGGEGQNGNKTSRTYSAIRSLRCGPNCLGVIDTNIQMNASFAEGMPAREMSVLFLNRERWRLLLLTGRMKVDWFFKNY